MSILIIIIIFVFQYIIASTMEDNYQNLIPAAVALTELIGGSINRSKANKMPYPEIDPLQTQYLSDLDRKRTLMESGNYFLPQQQEIKQQGRGAMNTIAKLTHGDIGATVNALQGVQRSTGRNFNELYGQMGMEALKMQMEKGGIIEAMAERRRQVLGYNKAQATTSSAQHQQDAMRILEVLLAKYAGSINSDKKPNNQLTQSNQPVQSWSDSSVSSNNNTVMGGQTDNSYPTVSSENAPTTGKQVDLNYENDPLKLF